MGLAAAHGLHLGDHAGEHAARAFYLYSGFDHVFYRRNPYVFARARHVDFNGCDLLVFQYKLLHRFGVNVQNAVLNFGFCCQLNVVDMDISEFQFQLETPPLITGSWLVQPSFI